MSDPFEAIRAHVEKNSDKERATFTVAGVKALLAAADAAALSSVQPVPWVKELEWEGDHATSVAGPYSIVKYHDRYAMVGPDDSFDGGYRFEGPREECKSAAQRDFEARIRSALLPTPQPVEGPSEPVARIYEAAKAVARYRGEIAQVEAKLHGRQDYRFYMEPVDATLDEAVQAVEDSARFATPPSPAQGAERAEPVVDADGDEIISPYEWLAQEFDRLAILRKMWTAKEVAAMIRRHDIERASPPVDSSALKALRELINALDLELPIYDGDDNDLPVMRAARAALSRSRSDG